MKLVGPVNMCLNETCIRVRVGKNLSEMFPFKNGLKQGDVLSPLHFIFASECAVRTTSIKKTEKKKKSKPLTLHSFLMSSEPRPGPSSAK